MIIKKIILILGFLFISVLLFYTTKLYEDNVPPFMNYKSKVDSLIFTNGSSFYFFGRLDTVINGDTLKIAVYGRLPILVFNGKKYNTFEKAHVKGIRLPKNVKYIKFKERYFSLDSIK